MRVVAESNRESLERPSTQQPSRLDRGIRMKIVLQTADRILLSLGPDELVGICNALNEVCHGVDIEGSEFHTRLGVCASELEELHNKLRAGAGNAALRSDSRIDVWADGASIQAICVTASGDPVDLSTHEARAFQTRLSDAITAADA